MIRWINKVLGTAPAMDPAIACEIEVLDVRDLVDKFGNSISATREKIDRGLTLLQQGKQVVVCCDYGISRSNAIAAGILCRFKSISLDQAIKEVADATGEMEMKLEPLRSVRGALEDDSPDSAAGETRILLTGGTGFIGRELHKVLSDRHFVLNSARPDLDLAAGALSLDLLVRKHRINCIVHLANPRVSASNVALGVTLTLLRNVLDVCRENRIRLIYPSSFEVYSGYRSTDLIADESLPMFPKGPLGETKYLCESLIDQHRRLYGLDCVVLRSSPVYGGAGVKPRFLHNFIGSARSNSTITTHQYRNGAPKLDLLHIDDFAAAIAAAIDSKFSGTVNVGTGRAVSTREIADWIVRATSSSSVVTSRDIEDFAANITMDSSLACLVLSWQAAIPWETGLGRLLSDIDSREHRSEQI